MFRMLDKDGDGVLTAEEFGYAMARFEEMENSDKIKDLTSVIVKKGQSMELPGKQFSFLLFYCNRVHKFCYCIQLILR
jgi:Ca2+-binding EF-hand superfamily protein